MKGNKRFNKKRIPPILRYVLYFLGILLLSGLIAIGVILLLSRWRLGLSDGQMTLFAGITQGCAAVISICLLVYQLDKGDDLEEKKRNIEEAQFILQYNQAFIENERMVNVERRLEMFSRNALEMGEPLIDDGNRQDFVNYLVYFEGLALSILRDEIGLDRIDDLMGYRFFLVMNNPEVQKEELQSFPSYYRGCIALYKKWKRHREHMRKPIPLVQYSLDLVWDNYSQYADGLPSAGAGTAGTI